MASRATFSAVTHHGAEDVPDPVPREFNVWQVWAKPQPGGAAAVLVINLSQEPLEGPVVVPRADLDVPKSALCLTDVWTGAVRTVPPGPTLDLGAPESHGSAFYTIDHRCLGAES